MAIFGTIDAATFANNVGVTQNDATVTKNAADTVAEGDVLELGGVAYCQNGDLTTVERLSVIQPMFVSPHGTGCSRYVDVLETSENYIATWQQSQQDGSQPLVMNVVPRSEIESLLTD